MGKAIVNNGGNDSFASGIQSAQYRYHDTKTMKVNRKMDGGEVCALDGQNYQKGKLQVNNWARESCLYLAGGVAVLRQITRELPRSFPMTQTLHASLSALSDTTHNEGKKVNFFHAHKDSAFYAWISTNLHFKK